MRSHLIVMSSEVEVSLWRIADHTDGADLGPGSAPVWGAGFGVAPKQSFFHNEKVPEANI